MKGLPRRPRRVAQTHAVAEKQKYLAVPSEEIKAASVAGLPAGAFRNASVTRFSRTVVSSPCRQQKTRRLLAPYSFFFDLPDKRHQSIPHFLSILRISRQILVQESFLIQKPPYERRHKQNERAQSAPRAERKRGSYEQRKHSCIHRVAHDGVGARRDDRLTLGYLDRGSSITILANDEVH